MATTTWNIDPAHSVAEFKVKQCEGELSQTLGRTDVG